MCRCGRAAGESLLGLVVSLRRGTRSRTGTEAGLNNQGLFGLRDGQLQGVLPGGSQDTYREHERLGAVVAGGWGRRKGMSVLDGVG